MGKFNKVYVKLYLTKTLSMPQTFFKEVLAKDRMNSPWFQLQEKIGKGSNLCLSLKSSSMLHVLIGLNIRSN